MANQRRIETWRRIWGEGDIFRGPRDFWMRFFGKNVHFQGTNFSDDLFFSHRPGFSDVPFLYPDFPYLYYVKCRKWPFPHTKNTFLTLFILSRTSDNTTSQNIGETDAWAVPPPQSFLGDRPPVPLGLRPWAYITDEQWWLYMLLLSLFALFSFRNNQGLVDFWFNSWLNFL